VLLHAGGHSAHSAPHDVRAWATIPWLRSTTYEALLNNIGSNSIHINNSNSSNSVNAAYGVEFAFMAIHHFYIIHFTLPLFGLVLIVVHLMYLHNSGSTNGLNKHNSTSNSVFMMIMLKDVLLLMLLLAAFMTLHFCVYGVGEALNNIPLNLEVTPPHIVPEWYFLPFYAILKVVPHSTTGIIIFVLAILVLLLMSKAT